MGTLQHFYEFKIISKLKAMLSFCMFGLDYYCSLTCSNVFLSTYENEVPMYSQHLGGWGQWIVSLS